MGNCSISETGAAAEPEFRSGSEGEENMKKMTVYVIHHAHTDVGYTSRQEKVEWNHVKFIERVVDILRQAYDGEKAQWRGFKWTCESFWSVEKFMEQSTPEYKADFVRFARSGNIGVSGNYLNFTELLDGGVMRETMEKEKGLADSLGLDISSAMTADINGYSWGYASVLADFGVRNLMSFVHSHHGYQTGKKQQPFFWQAANGKKILVWHGDHYNLGNEMKIHKIGAPMTYIIQDGLTEKGLDGWELSEKRIFSYVQNLVKEGYAYDFLPVTVSGFVTDNAPPNTKVIEFINEWNGRHGDEIELVMATPGDFFEALQPYEGTIPVYSGDWTDWWEDGAGSTPLVVKHYRDALRRYHICRRLDPEYRTADRKTMDTARYYLMLFAEHTWGYTSSISEPWKPDENDQQLRKAMYAGRAHEAASICYDRLCESRGMTAMFPENEYRLQAVNPHNRPVTAVVSYYLEGLLKTGSFAVVDQEMNEEVPYQLAAEARGPELNVLVSLEPGQQKSFRLETRPEAPLFTPGMEAGCGSDRVADLARYMYEDPDWAATPYELVTPYFKMEYEPGGGVTSVFDRIHNRELVRKDAVYPAFTPVYEVTPYKTSPCGERGQMGRNRKKVRTLREAGRLTDAYVTDNGPLFSRVILEYELKGTSLCRLEITAYRHLPKLDVNLILHKDSVWEPENLYMAMPFTTGEKEELWIDKTDCRIRPRIDQLPGSCVDFYSVQNGVAFVGEKNSLIVETPDTPLITMGTLKAHPIRLHGEEGVINRDHVYSWVMNNYWDTTFKATLGGFHQYNYSLRLAETVDPGECLDTARTDNTGVMSFVSFDK